VTAWLFGHRIIAWRLFDPDPVTGTLGYVRHAYQRRSLRQLLGSFFIGIAPAAAGGAALAALLFWMLTGEARAHLPGRLDGLAQIGLTLELVAALRGLGVFLGRGIWAGRTALLPLQLYAATCVTSHMAPSRSDLAGALPGALLLAGIVGVAGWLAAVAGRSVAAVAGLIPLLAALVALAGVVQATYVLVVALVGRLQRGPAVRRQTSGRSAGSGA
jgi:hypothetical protein